MLIPAVFYLGWVIGFYQTSFRHKISGGFLQDKRSIKVLDFTTVINGFPNTPIVISSYLLHLFPTFSGLLNTHLKIKRKS